MNLIEQNSLSALENNLLFAPERVEDELTSVPHEWREDLGLSLELSPQLIEINMGLTLKNVFEKFIFLFNMSSNTLTHAVRGQEISAPNTGPLTAILIGRSDSTTGRPDLTRATSELARLIDKDVVIENEVRVTVDNETTGVNLSASGANPINL
jgi:hypothetical protein